MRCGAFDRVEGTLCLVRHGQAALSGSKTKAPGLAGGYLHGIRATSAITFPSGPADLQKTCPRDQAPQNTTSLNEGSTRKPLATRATTLRAKSRQIAQGVLATRSRAKRVASSISTTRTPLLSMRSNSLEKPGRVSIGSAPDT